MNWDIEEILLTCKGFSRGVMTGVIQRIITDSRLVNKGDLFIAFSGCRYDGHEFVEEAIRKGATAAIVQEDRINKVPEAAQSRCIIVKDTLVALHMLAEHWRLRFRIPIVAVVGSNGKTTVKETLGACLKTTYQVLISPGNWNNQIGVPLTVLELRPTHQVAVFEVGTNHSGEMESLLKLLKPTHAILTSIGPEHLEFFKDLDGVWTEETKIVEAIPKDGVAVYPAGIYREKDIIQKAYCKINTVGFSKRCDWQISNLCLSTDFLNWNLTSKLDHSYNGNYRTKLLGFHQAINCTLAIALAYQLGVKEVNKIKEAIETLIPIPGRMCSIEVGGITIIDDTYNANAASMTMALKTLATIRRIRNARAIAVLGDMAELGDKSILEHKKIGLLAAQLQIDAVYTLGELGVEIAKEAYQNGLKEVEVYIDDREGLIKSLLNILKPGDIILFKGSHCMRMDELVAQLVEKIKMRSQKM